MATLDPKEKVIAAFAEALLPSLDKEADAAAKKGDDALAKTLRLRGDFSPHVVKEVCLEWFLHVSLSAGRDSDLCIVLTGATSFHQQLLSRMGRS